jgi:hypothetical protein
VKVDTATRADLGQDRFDHPLRIPQHVVVPKAQDAIAVTVELGRSGVIATNPLIRPMLVAIDLDDQTQPVMHEVREIGPNRRLPPEMAGWQLDLPQRVPELAFRRRCEGP